MVWGVRPEAWQQSGCTAVEAKACWLLASDHTSSNPDASLSCRLVMQCDANTAAANSAAAVTPARKTHPPVLARVSLLGLPVKM